jgi:hypothetical protein
VEPQCLVGFSRLGPAPHDPQALPTPTDVARPTLRLARGSSPRTPLPCPGARTGCQPECELPLPSAPTLDNQAALWLQRRRDHGWRTRRARWTPRVAGRPTGVPDSVAALGSHGRRERRALMCGPRSLHCPRCASPVCTRVRIHRSLATASDAVGSCPDTSPAGCLKSAPARGAHALPLLHSRRGPWCAGKMEQLGPQDCT